MCNPEQRQKNLTEDEQHSCSDTCHGPPFNAALACMNYD
jgi:hypothetical protein